MEEQETAHDLRSTHQRSEADSVRSPQSAVPDPAPPTQHSALSTQHSPGRYARQVIFPGIGVEGQERLGRARVAVVGCGALGSVIAEHLARAGVGLLRIVDRDFVELTNLQRQVLFDEADAERGAPKAVAAAEKLGRINSAVAFEPLVQDVNADTVEELVRDVDLVMDGTDNFETRYLLNEACVKLGRPWIYSAAIASYGLTMVVLPRQTPCLQCLFPAGPQPGSVDTCDTAGVLNPIPGIIAGLACSEALKLLVGAHHQLTRAITWVDVWHNTFQRTPLSSPMEDCQVCQHGRYEHLQALQGSAATALCGRDAVQVRPRGAPAIDLSDLARRLSSVGQVVQTPYLLRLFVGSYEITLFPDARAIVKGTDDPSVARSLYARYVGL